MAITLANDKPPDDHELTEAPGVGAMLERFYAALPSTEYGWRTLTFEASEDLLNILRVRINITFHGSVGLTTLQHLKIRTGILKLETSKEVRRQIVRAICSSMKITSAHIEYINFDSDEIIAHGLKIFNCLQSNQTLEDLDIDVYDFVPLPVQN